MKIKYEHARLIVLVMAFIFIKRPELCIAVIGTVVPFMKYLGNKKIKLTDFDYTVSGMLSYVINGVFFNESYKIILGISIFCIWVFTYCALSLIDPTDDDDDDDDDDGIVVESPNFEMQENKIPNVSI